LGMTSVTPEITKAAMSNIAMYSTVEVPRSVLDRSHMTRDGTK
jgi:hypothetical protein